MARSHSVHTKTGWTPAEIKAALLKAGWTLTKIGQALHITVSAVSYVVSGRRRTPYVRKLIAEIIGVPVTEIWPDCVGWDMERRRAPNLKAVG